MILRSAFRALSCRPTLVAITVLMLAVGVGGTTAIYSVVYHLILQPVPAEEPHRLVWVWKSQEGMGFSITPSPDEVRTFEQATTLSELASMSSDEVVVRVGEEAPEFTIVTAVAPDFFEMVQVAPVLGRPFLNDDAELGALPVVVISHDMWRSRFGGSSDAVGRSVQLNGQRHEIVGVMSAGFRFPTDVTDIWRPLIHDPDNPRRGLNVLARLAPDTSAAQAEAELNGLLAGLSTGQEDVWNARLMSLADMMGTRTIQQIWVLFLAVGLVLLIACANVAGLILVHGSSRSAQLAIRSALGAGRGVLVKQLLAESVVLSVAGGLLGLLFAHWGLDLIRVLRPTNLNELVVAQIDRPVLLFSLLLAIGTGLAAGLAPALRLSRPDLAQMLRSLSSSTSGRRQILRRSLIAAEMAMGTFLILGAGSLIASFTALQNADPGYDPDGLVMLSISLPESRYPGPEVRGQFYEDLETMVARIPGVQGVSHGTGLPSQAGLGLNALEIDGRPAVESSPTQPMLIVDEDYFDVARVPLIAGTTFEAGIDNQVIVSRQFAERYFQGQSPLGERIRFSADNEWSTIVGVVENVRAFGLNDSRPRPLVYYPLEPGSEDRASFLIRTSGEPATLDAPLTSVVATLDSDLPVREIATAPDILARSIGRERFTAVLFSIFSISGVLLACLGLYGLVSYVVQERTWEIGIRMALGARRRSVMALVVRSGLGLAAVGMLIGFGGFFWFNRLLVSWIVNIQGVDPVAAAISLSVLVLAAVFAVLIPASRAARVDPSDALRSE